MTTDTNQDKAIRDDIFEYASYLEFGELHFKVDNTTGLRACIAIHSLKRGPALGGCRFIEYGSTMDAVRDAMRLAKGMSYKAAICDLTLGGGKAVIMKPANMGDREAFFKVFGQFVDSLNGRYITAKDSGSSTADMDAIATETAYVTSTSKMENGLNGDPSPFTSYSVCRGIEAAVQFKLGQTGLNGIHVAIQGVGAVGYGLAKRVHELGATLTVSDINPESTQRCAQEFGAQVVEGDAIYQVDCDVFSPCALGAVLNDDTIPLLKAGIIVGAANNQLARTRHGEILRERGVLYAPDYITNAGGLIHASAQYHKSSEKTAMEQISRLYGVLLGVFDRAEQDGKPTNEVADAMAEEKL